MDHHQDIFWALKGFIVELFRKNKPFFYTACRSLFHTLNSHFGLIDVQKYLVFCLIFSITPFVGIIFKGLINMPGIILLSISWQPISGSRLVLLQLSESYMHLSSMFEIGSRWMDYVICVKIYIVIRPTKNVQSVWDHQK